MPPRENPDLMKRHSTQPRRPNLATIVGSGLAVVAAGSLLAFSSLAEQAGLQGLSTGGLRPAAPERAGRPQAITVPAPAPAPPAEPGDAVDDLVRRVVERDERAPQPVLRVAVAPPEPPKRPKARSVASRARAATVANRDWDGPPYGHAYGYHKDRGERPEPARRPKKNRKPKASEPAPAYARTTNGGGAKPPKPSKPPKAKKVGKSNGKAKGHSKHGHGNGNGHGKGKGHSKHGH
ncbi:MAG: hypothetical protein M3279_11020 [Actinomycetota bacterium]|nr:hypothetical protein [Actinomycetota bacterium]